MPVPEEIRKTLDWLIQVEEFTQARNLALTASRFLPSDHPEATDFLAMILYRTKHYPEALLYAKKTVELIPNQIEARYNLARCLNSVGEASQAEKEIRTVIQQRPNWLDPQLDLAMYLCMQGRYDESENLLIELQKKWDPNDQHQAVIRFNLAWHHIRHGRLKVGMDDLLMGRKIRIFGAHSKSFPKPKLSKGLSVAGKRVLLVGEAGAGDEIINARFAKIIQARGGKCIWVTGQGFENLFSRVEGIDQVVGFKDISNITYDYWAPSMDLFSILDLEQSELPDKAYLSPNPEFVEKWKPQISKNNKLKVGLRWQGNPLYEQDLYRSVPFELIRMFFSVPNNEFFSLQKDTGIEEIRASDPIQDLSTQLTSWEDTTAVISLLDVVVTSCTSVAHLAGALGKKTLVFTPMLPYYIWAYPRDKSIWYPDVHLFRQKKYHDWQNEAEAILKELKRMAT